MSSKPTTSMSRNVVVFFTDASVAVRPCHVYVKPPVTPPMAMHLAVAYPGGFTGFGPTANSAVEMAVARTRANKARAMHLGISAPDWYDGIARRVSPMLLALMSAASKDATPVGIDDDVPVVMSRIDRIPAMDAAWSRGCPV
jgi:hypothetical protein